MLNYFIWIPILLAINVYSAKLSIANQHGDNRAALGMFLIGLIPLWIITSRFSKNLLFDAMLYDTLVVIAYTVGIVYFGDKALSVANMIGMALIFIGLIFVRI